MRRFESMLVLGGKMFKCTVMIGWFLTIGGAQAVMWFDKLGFVSSWCLDCSWRVTISFFNHNLIIYSVSSQDLRFYNVYRCLTPLKRTFITWSRAIQPADCVCVCLWFCYLSISVSRSVCVYAEVCFPCRCLLEWTVFTARTLYKDSEHQEDASFPVASRLISVLTRLLRVLFTGKTIKSTRWSRSRARGSPCQPAER